METRKKINLNYEEITDKIFSLVQKCVQKADESNHKSDDARTMIFTLLRINIQNLLFSITLSKNLKNKNFYSENNFSTKNIDDEYMQNALEEYVSSASNSYFISIFVQIENYLRIIAKHKKIDNFSINVTVKDIIKEFGLKDKNTQLWEIFSDLRNCMHNGGFFNHNGKTVNYDGTRYEFKKNEPIKYGGIPNYLFFTNELIDNLISEINTKSSIDDYIEHNYSNLKYSEED